jgi:2,3,4,5-tetrahydropyridine-2,6-dicarboxylate N-acetyltransferase
MNSYEIIEYISKSKKSTPVKIFLKGNLKDIPFEDYFGNENSGVLFCELSDFENYYSNNKEKIEKYIIESDRRNSAIPLLNTNNINARIEPGAIIRNMVEIEKNVVIMMGAVINIGAKIGEKTMIDMNAVIGGRAQIGKNCHIGAGAVVAGVIEPPSAEPVIIEDNVLIGANAVILEGVKVGANSVVSAGAVVTKDVASNTVVAGIPAKVIKVVDEKTKDKTKLLEELRNL